MSRYRNISRGPISLLLFVWCGQLSRDIEYVRRVSGPRRLPDVFTAGDGYYLRDSCDWSWVYLKCREALCTACAVMQLNINLPTEVDFQFVAAKTIHQTGIGDNSYNLKKLIFRHCRNENAELRNIFDSECGSKAKLNFT